MSSEWEKNDEGVENGGDGRKSFISLIVIIELLLILDLKARAYLRGGGGGMEECSLRAAPSSQMRRPSTDWVMMKIMSY